MRGGDRDRRDESEKPRWRQYKNEGEEKNENHCLQDQPLTSSAMVCFPRRERRWISRLERGKLGGGEENKACEEIDIGEQQQIEGKGGGEGEEDEKLLFPLTPKWPFLHVRNTPGRIWEFMGSNG